VSLQRFESSAQLGSAQDQAKKRYTDELGTVGKGLIVSPVSGLADQAASVSGRSTVAKVTSQNTTVVARAGNIVVIVEFQGATLPDPENPTKVLAVRASRPRIPELLEALGR